MPTKKPVKKAVAKKTAAPAKPAAKAPSKPVKAPAKQVKPAAKAAKPASKSPAKPQASSAKPTVKAVTKPTPKVEVKPVPKVVAKPAAKAAPKPGPVAPLKPAPKSPPAKPVPAPVPVVSKKVSASKPKPEPKPTTIKKPVRKETPLKEVKVPKTSVSTKVEYKPEYKSMEQRTNKEERKMTNIPLLRYTDSELNEFRELIQKKLDLAKRELSYLQGLITRKDDMGGDESENRYMTMEDGSISMEREQLSQMASRQITYIDHLEKAIIRIENKTYGICRVTGKLIDKNRLRAVPHATLSLEAKLGLVKGGE